MHMYNIHAANDRNQARGVGTIDGCGGRTHAHTHTRTLETCTALLYVDEHQPPFYVSRMCPSSSLSKKQLRQPATHTEFSLHAPKTYTQRALSPFLSTFDLLPTDFGSNSSSQTA